MRIEINLHSNITSPEPVLMIDLFTKSDEEYLNGCEDGIYSCAMTYPEDRKSLIAMIEDSVNDCLELYAIDQQNGEM